MEATDPNLFPADRPIGNLSGMWQLGTRTAPR